jgi:hypothetical protein
MRRALGALVAEFRTAISAARTPSNKRLRNAAASAYIITEPKRIYRELEFYPDHDVRFSGGSAIEMDHRQRNSVSRAHGRVRLRANSAPCGSMGPWDGISGAKTEPANSPLKISFSIRKDVRHRAHCSGTRRVSEPWGAIRRGSSVPPWLAISAKCCRLPPGVHAARTGPARGTLDCSDV